ncbi:MAG: acyltransferase 3 [Humibacillus sp.]|nr:acyltransferase 3 [Humibacillus sp.]
MTTSARAVRPGHDARPAASTSTTSGTAGTDAATGRPARIDGLDGLRALAIVSVLIYHFDPAWLPGGFLGVDVFFVVSGFLITTLLVREHQRTGRVSLSSFWVRRARRLLPALALCVVGSVLIARVVSTDLLVEVGRQMLGALTFSTNWIEITAGSSYFDQTAPQLFMNFWSLAVEEQFYLVWPLVTIGLLTLSSRLRVGAAVALGAGSALLMAALYVPDADATRVYYGTDTHLVGLMAGAALAFAWANPRLARFVTPSSWGRHGRVAGPVAVVVLLTEMVLLDEAHPLTFRGGIALASVATTVLIMAVVDAAPARSGGLNGLTGLQRAARHPAAAWVGARSYSLYLWHWPVILLVSLDNPSAPGTLSHVLTRTWCVIVTLALADLTYRFVETPFRALGFRVVAQRVRAALAGLARPTRQGLAALAAFVVVVVIAIVATAPAQSETARMLSANESAAEAGAARPDAALPGSTGGTSTEPTPVAGTGSPAAPASDHNATFTMPAGKDIDAYGDSIMVGSLAALRYYFPDIRIDAKSNRRWSDGLAEVLARGQSNRRAVVLAFGTNAGVDEARVVQVLDALGPNRMIVLVNVMGPFSRIDKDNAALERVASGRGNVAIADWASAVRAHPDQVQSDRIHPSLTGAHLFSKTVRAALAQLSERNTGAKVVLKELPVP